MTEQQKKIIERNLAAYKANFDYIHIESESYGNGFYVYTSKDRKESGYYTQYCYNIDYLNGWLYGAVQAVNNIMKKSCNETRPPKRIPGAYDANGNLICAFTKEDVEASYNNSCSLLCGQCKVAEIVIPDNVTTIGRRAFAQVYFLTSIKIPNDIKEIKYKAFYNCASLTTINLPDDVNAIADYAFSECISLSSVIYKGVTYTEKYKLIEKLEEDDVIVGFNVFYNTHLLS